MAGPSCWHHQARRRLAPVSAENLVPGSVLGLADLRHLLHAAQMRCPEETSQTAEERHPGEHRADEPADELSPCALAREMDGPVCSQRLNARGVGSAQNLDDRGDGETSGDGDGYPACSDPRARGHTSMTQADAIRCRTHHGVRIPGPITEYTSAGLRPMLPMWRLITHARSRAEELGLLAGSPMRRSWCLSFQRDVVAGLSRCDPANPDLLLWEDDPLRVYYAPWI